MPPSNILIASHRGSRSFFTSEENGNIDAGENPKTTYVESIELIKPDITLISCSDYDSAHHLNKDALKPYETHTSNKQVYTTFNKGHLSGFIDIDGNFTVVPSRFNNIKNAAHTVGFRIKCVKIIKKKQEEVNNNSNINVGIHMLRCWVINKKKNYDIAKVFIINGI